ncbi:MAG: RNase H family protein [Pirellulales bacterium]
MDRPLYFLFTTAQDEAGLAGGRWQFQLKSVDGRGELEAGDAEHSSAGERLELLAVVRGLEALDQPSRVKLVTTSRQVARGLRHGLEAWRANNWHWERFGRWVPIKDADLWRRIDRALQFHEVECQSVATRVDAVPAVAESVPAVTGSASSAAAAAGLTTGTWQSRGATVWGDRAAVPGDRGMSGDRGSREGREPAAARSRWHDLWQEVTSRLAWRVPTRSMAS